MAIEREVRWLAKAVLRRIDGADSHDTGLRGILPSVPVAEGTLGDMIDQAMAQPPAQRWRYLIASDAAPYLVSEEIAALAAQRARA